MSQILQSPVKIYAFISHVSNISGSRDRKGGGGVWNGQNPQ